MITIDEELLFQAIEGMPESYYIKALILSCKSKGKLIKPCEDCNFKHFSGMMLWTSVEDALPEESGSYIVCTDKSEAFMTHFYADHNRWGGKSGDKHITHWMKRPKAPGRV